MTQRGFNVWKFVFIGAMVAVVAGGIVLLSGWVSGAEGKLLVESMLPSMRFFASATVLALMVTVLSVSRSFEQRFSQVHYQRMRQIGLSVVATFIGAMLLLALVTVPLNQSDSLPTHWFSVIYYLLLVSVALLGGLLVTIIWMLYETLADLIAIFTGDGSDSDLIRDHGE